MPRLILLATVLVTLALGVASPALGAVPYVAETPLAITASTQGAPQIGEMWYGNWRTVWEDDAAGDWDVVVDQLWAETLPLGTSNQRHPVASQYWVVYEDDRAGDWDIYACSTSQSFATPTPSPSPSETPVATGAGDQLDPAIDGAMVVFEDKTRGNWDISSFSLDTGVRQRLTSNRSAQIDPAIDGDKVVYADHRNGNWDIYLVNLKTRREKRLTTNRADQTSPQIGNGLVVYQDHRNGNWDIYAYVLKSGVERRLTTNKHDQTEPQIDRAGHRDVVYRDDRNGNDDIYLYDFTYRVEKRLTDDAAGQSSPSIYKDSVVWSDARGGDADVYSGDLDYHSLHLGGPHEAPGYNTTVTFHGTLSGVEGVKVTKTGAGGTRSIATGSLGNFSFSVPHVRRKITVRCAFRSDASHLPANPVSLSVKPHALLTRPVIAKAPHSSGLIVPNGNYICRGYLKPQHRAGSQAVTLRLYGKNWRTGEWVCTKTMTPRIRDYAGYSTYSSVELMLLPTPKYSQWKIRATHSDKDHALTLSPFSVTK